MPGVASIVLRAVGATLPPPSAQLIGRWTLDEASGATAIDEAEHSDGSYSNVALQQDPLVDGDPGSSVRFFGNSAVAVPHVAAYEVESYSVVVYGQVQSGPGPGANAQLLQKDRGGLPGGFQIAVCNDAGTLRPHVYTKDAFGNPIWVGSSNGVAGAELVAGTAFMLVMTCGGTGTRVYLDKTEIGSTSNHIDLVGNDEQIGIGRYRPGISDAGGFDGWIDEVRFYQGVLTADEIATLPSTQDLVIPPVQEDTYTLPMMPSAPSGTTRYVSSGVGTGAPAAGNDASGDGSVGNPYATIAKALSQASSGDTIVLRAGVYREANLNAGISNLTIKGYHQDIAADPLDPASWPIIDGQAESSIAWELVDAAAGREEYRTVATNIAGGSAVPQGMVISGTSQQIPRFEPLNGEVNPTPAWRLYPYRGTTGARSRAAFQHTGAVSTNENTAYNGPGLYRESDGRIHIRLQPVHPSYYGGETWDKIADKNPANNIIGIWPLDRLAISSMANGVRIEGIFFRNFDRIYNGGGRNGVMRGCIWQGMHFQNNGLRFTSGSADFIFEHNIVVGGLPDPFSWHLCKNVSDNGGLNYGRTGMFTAGSGTYNIRIKDNMVTGVFDVFLGEGSDSVYEIDHNYITVRDDLQQCASNVRQLNVHHNFCIGPAHGHNANSSPADPVEWYFHHNVVLLNQMYLNQVGQRRGHSAFVFHGNQVNCPQKVYHNLVVGTVPCREAGGAAILFPPYNAICPRINYTFNNIFMWYPRVPPGGSASSDTFLSRRHRAHDDNYRYVSDGNAYWGLRGPGVTAALRLWQDIWSTAQSNGQDFADLSAWKASAKHTASIGRNGYADGWDTNSIQADPLLVGGTPAMLDGDPRGKPSSDWLPTASVYKTGAIDLSPSGLNTGWPDTGTYQPWRGALDPNGDGAEVGPRAA
jgi:hypothetical protein